MVDLVAEIGMKFDKNDIVIVAVAKIEAEIRKNIRESKADLDEIDVKLAEIEKEFTENGELNIPKTITAKQKIFEKALSDAKVSDINIFITHNVSLNEDSENTYTLSISESKDPRRAYSFVLCKANTKLSKRQNDIIILRKNLMEKRNQRVKDGVEWKKRLQDIPAAERQMKAVVVEHEMSKSKDGQALIKVLTNKYLSTMKQLEM